MKNITDISFDERLKQLLNGIDLYELQEGNTDECMRFYLKNYDFIRASAASFCRKELDKNNSYCDDLMQEFWLHIPDLDFSSYGSLCKSMRRIFYLCTIPDRDELAFARWDLPANEECKNPLSEIATIIKLEETPTSNEHTFNQLIDWLRANLSPKDFKYANLRFVELADTQTIFRKLGYSPLCGETFITRLDRNIMMLLCDKYADVSSSVGGIFEVFKNKLPQVLEKRKNAMMSIKLRQTA